ncbi:MAG: tRNA (N(6)-L-threonylcarbamoyladenosine(37)-C(2))-methylthiotransferase [Candidatus Diapherotrites archaeon]|nr:tRNA (N(6)-L-threonylcarbamoyladenosine(37)-C(2))-methylthiotransferase [Candidatus Diapherotrites archaeon]
MLKFYIEGYGCSLAKSETEQIIEFLKQRNFLIVNNPKEADYIIINCCGVKETTEKRMLSRIEYLNENKKKLAKIISFGCLSIINPDKIKEIDKDIITVGTKLEELCEVLEIEEERFSPALAARVKSDYIGIIPIATGCLKNCSYCAVKQARGNLRSYEKKEIIESIKAQIKTKKEFWLTAQDCGCYGLDIDTNIYELLKEITKIDEKFRVRIGMINPSYAKVFIDKILPLFESGKLYRFLHLPVQSGSNKILDYMNRGYTREDFLEISKKIRDCYQDFTIATDIIVGFPGEDEKEFRETLDLLYEVKPNIVNISRFGPRPKTKAKRMKQIDSKIKKERSRIVSAISKKISLEENEKMLGKIDEAYFSEIGKNNKYVGRVSNYRAVITKENFLGKFAKIKINKYRETYLEGEPIYI